MAPTAAAASAGPGRAGQQGRERAAAEVRERCPRHGPRAAGAGRAPRGACPCRRGRGWSPRCRSGRCGRRRPRRPGACAAACLTAWPMRSSRSARVGKAGHRVVQQQVAHLLLAVLLPGAVDDDAGRPDDLAVAVVPRRHLEHQPEASSCARRVRPLEEALPAPDGLFERFVNSGPLHERGDRLATVVARPGRRRCPRTPGCSRGRRGHGRRRSTPTGEPSYSSR